MRRRAGGSRSGARSFSLSVRPGNSEPRRGRGCPFGATRRAPAQRRPDEGGAAEQQKVAAVHARRPSGPGRGAAAGRTTARPMAKTVSSAGTRAMLTSRSVVSSAAISRRSSSCTPRSCRRVSTMSCRAASMAARCSGVITAWPVAPGARRRPRRAGRAASSRVSSRCACSACSVWRYRASASRWISSTSSNGRRLAPRLRSPISASPPASVPTRLATNGPLSLNGVACLLAEEILHAHPEAVGQDVAVGDHHEVGRAVGLRPCRRGKSAGRFCPAGRSGGPVKADFSTPRTRAAITRGPPSGLKLARMLRRVRGTAEPVGRDQAGLRRCCVSSGVNSIAASGLLRQRAGEATVTCCRSAVAGSSWLMPSRMLNQAT